MSSGEILTRATIWIFILGYAAGAILYALTRMRTGKLDSWTDRNVCPTWGISAVRLLWTVACLGLLAHVACAFQYYHGWSHTAAYRETARQTNELFGLNWGGGTYVNYALLIGCVADVGWWWVAGLDSYRQRSWLLMAAWHGFLIFIIFNATVIFATGFTRWAGLGVCLGLGMVWWLARYESTRTLA